MHFASFSLLSSLSPNSAACLSHQGLCVCARRRARTLQSKQVRRGLVESFSGRVCLELHQYDVLDRHFLLLVLHAAKVCQNVACVHEIDRQHTFMCAPNAHTVKRSYGESPSHLYRGLLPLLRQAGTFRTLASVPDLFFLAPTAAEEKQRQVAKNAQKGRKGG